MERLVLFPEAFLRRCASVHVYLYNLYKHTLPTILSGLRVKIHPIDVEREKLINCAWNQCVWARPPSDTCSGGAVACLSMTVK